MFNEELYSSCTSTAEDSWIRRQVPFCKQEIRNFTRKYGEVESLDDWKLEI